MELEFFDDIAHKGYTLGELKMAFDKVANPNDWRAPINAVIHKRDLNRVVAAIEFYTATETKTNDLGNYVQVMSVGYRNGPAGP